MVCYSTIRTKMDNGERLADALRREGFEVAVSGDEVRATAAGKQIIYTKTGGAYAIRAYGSHGVGRAELDSIGRRYAEIGVREFAQRRGFSIAESDGTRMTVVNRRG